MKSVKEQDKIFLTGFMGSGKTSVGRVLAAKLHVPFIDLDARIARSAGMSVSRIFRLKGESCFRRLESAGLDSVCKMKGRRVIATGGGVVLDKRNSKLMKKNGTIVYLHVSAVQTVRRLAKDRSRPLLKGPGRLQKIKDLLRERKRLYSMHDISINTCGKSVKEISDKIFQKLV